MSAPAPLLRDLEKDPRIIISPPLPFSFVANTQEISAFVEARDVFVEENDLVMIRSTALRGPHCNAVLECDLIRRPRGFPPFLRQFTPRKSTTDGYFFLCWSVSIVQHFKGRVEAWEKLSVDLISY